MSDFANVAVTCGSILVAMMISQVGRRHLGLHSVLLPIGLLGYFGASYLHTAPTGTSGDWSLYAVGAAVGLLFAAATSALTRVESDGRRMWSVCGVGFAAVWSLAMGLRVLFVGLVDNDADFTRHLGTFLVQHDIASSAIAPAFIVWAVTMAVARIVVVQVRARRLRAAVAAQLPASPLVNA